MIIMDLKLDNIFSFNDFSMNFSYPKKIVGSTIEHEYLLERTNFRYKKINVLMGSNASGKTTLGRAIMGIFNFINKKNLEALTPFIANKSKDASFSMDFVIGNGFDTKLHRITTSFIAREDEKYDSQNVLVSVMSTEILKNDNYEMCAKRLDEISNESTDSNYVTELEKIKGLSWFFIFPVDSYDKKYSFSGDNPKYITVLGHVLRTLDPSIVGVEKINIENVKNAYAIQMFGGDVIFISDGKILNPNRLSTGTKAGIEIAEMLASMCFEDNDFYYCDEKFSYVNSDIEKGIFSLMIDKLKGDRQLFFTTHNQDVLDMPLPKHSFSLLKKTIYEDEQIIKAISVADYLKKGSDSVRNAVDNDLFNSAPDLSLLYEIDEL